MSVNRKRQSKGKSTGGQFAPENKGKQAPGDMLKRPTTQGTQPRSGAVPAASGPIDTYRARHANMMKALETKNETEGNTHKEP